MFAYTLLGLEFFAYKVKFNELEEVNLITGVSPRINFDGLLNGLFAVFITIQSNQWPVLLYDVTRAVGKPSIIFCVLLVTIG